MASREHLWVLALAAGTVVGSVMARRDPGNARYELCRAAVHPDYRGRPDINAALDVLRRDTVSRPDCEVLYGNVRSERARRKLGNEATRWSWTGADGGMHVLHGEREEHLFGMAFNAERTVTRIVPHRSVLPASVVARKIGRAGRGVPGVVRAHQRPHPPGDRAAAGRPPRRSNAATCMCCRASHTPRRWVRNAWSTTTRRCGSGRCATPPHPDTWTPGCGAGSSATNWPSSR